MMKELPATDTSNFTTHLPAFQWSAKGKRAARGLVFLALVLSVPNLLWACDAVPPLMTGVTNICPSQTGTIGVGNAADYVSFIWSTGGNTAQITISASGTYTVTVTDAASCTAIGTVNVTSVSSVTAIDAVITPQNSCLTPNGAIDITVSPLGTYLYNWSNGQTVPDVSGLVGEHYTITVTDVSGCSATATFTVPDNTIPPLFDVSNSPCTCMQPDGNIDLQMQNPAGNYSFIWSSGQTTEDVFQIFPGTYTVTITDDDTGCTSIGTTTLGNTNFLPSVSGTTTPNTSCVNTDGSIITEVYPDWVPYTYAWSNGANSAVLSNLAPGTYTVTVTHGVVCTASASFTITNIPASPDIVGNVAPEICNTGNGGIDILVMPFGNYNYQWSNGAGTEDLGGVSEGFYTVTVSSPTTSCSATASYFVPNNTVDLLFFEFMTPVTNCITPNGALDIDVTPPNNYTYSWSNGAATQDLSNVSAGAYSVTVSLGNGCTSTASFNIEEQFNYPFLLYNVSPTSCGLPNGAIDLFVDPPTGTIYSWSNGAITEDVSNLQAGNYGVTVTSTTNGCSTLDNITVNNGGTDFTLSALSTANTSCASVNGAVNLSVTPAGSYTYLWSNGANSQDLQNVGAGSYTVTVSAGGNCTATASYTVPNNSGAPSLTAIAADAICGLSNGGVDITASPSGVYQYLWSNGATSEDLPSVAPGSYSVTVTDVNGCSNSTAVQVPNTTTAFSLSATPSPNTSCTGGDGSIDLSTSASGTLSYLWSNGANSQDLQNLLAGTYTVTVTQGVNCSQTATYLVTSNTPAPVATPSMTPASCGLGTGTIDLSVQPAAGNLFSWSNGQATEDLQNLAPGSYSVTITGANGCTATNSILVPDAPANFTPTGISIPNTSCAVPNGSIDLSVAQPGSFDYLWSTGASSEDLQNLAPGNYSVTVTLGATCSLSASFTVENDTPAPLVAGVGIAATCGQANGAIDLNVTTSIGGTEFLWSNGINNEDLQNLAPGTYNVTVTAGNGCTATASVQVTNLNSNFSLAAAPIASSSCLAANGSVVLNVSPSGSYAYLWSNGATSQNLQNVPAGNYSVTVTDASGCSDIATATVTGSVQPTVAITGPSAVCNGSPASLQADAGFVDYEWSGGGSAQVFLAPQSGTYTVTATDANGCTATADFMVGNLPDPTPTISGPTVICAGSVATFTVGGGIFTATTWSDGTNASSINASQAGAYTVTVTNANGCTAVASQNLSIGSSLQPAIVADVDGCAATAALDAGFGYANYQWSNGQTGQVLAVTAPGNYTVTVSDGSGCTGEDGANVAFPILPQVQISGATAICVGGSTQFSVPAIYQQIVWSTGETNAAIAASQPGNYTVTITDANGCTATDDHLLAVGGSLVPDIAPAPPTCDGTEVLDAGPGYATYQWSNGQTTQSILVSAAGTYAVTVSDSPSGGCSGSASEAVSFPAPPQVQISGAQELCEGDETELAASGNFAQYLWSTGDIAQQITISQGGSYAVTITNVNGCTATNAWNVAQLLDETTYLQAVSCSPLDTGTVQTLLSNQAGCDSMVVTTTVLAPPITSSVQLLVCEGELVLYQGAGIPVGGTQDFVFAAANGCDSIVTVSVAAHPAVSFDLSATTTCWNLAEGNIQVETSAGAAPFQYALNGGAAQESPMFTGLSGGAYTVVVEDANGCKHAENTAVPQTSPTQLLVEDAVIPCPEGRVKLQPTLIADDPIAVQWQWSGGSVENTLEVTKDGIYQVQVDDGCEVISRTISVSWDDEYHRNNFFYVPNSFSPNDDAINDDFLAFVVPTVEVLSFEMRVFDRWGTEMFYSNDMGRGWDGQQLGQHMQPGVYAWYIQSKVLVCGLREVDVFLKGGVTVMR
ncbi:MAG: gliding motility-associated C-terminal domain-containing protein [Saprospiraceae bacterium]|nr:gliding motility-associated C-terminal domain-containing protein [Saprospiraceae bacterium]